MSDGRQRTKMVRALLAAVLAVMLTTGTASAFVCAKAGNGQCLHWAERAATLQSFLGSPQQTLSNGTTSWDQNAVDAGNDWNAVGADFHFTIDVGGQFVDPCGTQGTSNVCSDPSGSNPIYFANSKCGAGFGDAIELTLACWVDQTGALLNAAVLANNTVQWDAYDGPLRTFNGQYVYDLRRVMLHELGHVLGLDHPDAQHVAAIMNSHVSNLDRLQPDDIGGIFSLYGGGPAPSNGCQIDAHPVPSSWQLGLSLCLVVLWLRRSGCRKLSADSKAVRPE
jgi:hypothetical protein